MTTGRERRVAGRTASDSIARMSSTEPLSDGLTVNWRERVPGQFTRHNADPRATMRPVTDLSALGWTISRAAGLPAGCVPARVARVDRCRLSVLSEHGEQRVVPSTSLYASGPGGPAVGDWVALRGELAVAVLPRSSAFVRTVAGRTSAAQVVAANLDTVLVVDSLAGDARLRRVERYLAVAWSSGATPVVVLTKADLCDDVAAVVEQVREDALGVEVLAVQSAPGEGVGAGPPPAAGAGDRARVRPSGPREAGT